MTVPSSCDTGFIVLSVLKGSERVFSAALIHLLMADNAEAQGKSLPLTFFRCQLMLKVKCENPRKRIRPTLIKSRND